MRIQTRREGRKQSEVPLDCGLWALVRRRVRHTFPLLLRLPFSSPHPLLVLADLQRAFLDLLLVALAFRDVQNARYLLCVYMQSPSVIRAYCGRFLRDGQSTLTLRLNSRKVCQLAIL